jgi:hypothetical protein
MGVAPKCIHTAASRLLHYSCTYSVQKTCPSPHTIYRNLGFKKCKARVMDPDWIWIWIGSGSGLDPDPWARKMKKKMNYSLAF